ncbi:CidA/LrgA family protein [Vibrio sp. CDRSL-10 TSBA]
MTKLMNAVMTLGQIAALTLIWFIADELVAHFHLPLPANLTGMLMLLALVMCRVVKVDWFRRGASWLLAEMLLFFIPAVVAVINYQDMLAQQGLRILLVLVLSTIIVIACTAWVVDKLYRYELKMARRRSQLGQEAS